MRKLFEDIFNNVELGNLKAEPGTPKIDNTDAVNKLVFSFDFTFDINKLVTVKPNFKKYFYKIDQFLDEYATFFEKYGDITVSVMTQKNTRDYDYTILTRNMVPPERDEIDINDSASNIYETIEQNAIRYVNGYEPNWKGDVDSKHYGIVLNFLINVYGKLNECDPKTFAEEFVTLMQQFVWFKNDMRSIQTHVSVSMTEFAMKLYDSQKHEIMYKKAALPIENWGWQAYAAVYKQLYGLDKPTEDYKELMTASDKSKKIKDTFKLKNVHYRFHMIYFLPETRSRYEYTPYGYTTEDSAIDKFYCIIGRKDPDEWTYEKINEWMVESFIDKCTDKEKIQLCQGYNEVTVSIYLALRDKTDVPPRSDKKKRYVYEITENIVPTNYNIKWRIIYTDGNFIQLGRPSHAMIPSNLGDVYQAYRNYKDNLEHGVYGQKCLEHMPDIFKNNS